jgi:MIP family channel proteins
MYSKPQKLAAEFIGTFALIFFGVGSICADQYLRTSSNGTIGLGLLGIALAHGLAIGIMVSSLGHISGGHFNPAVTIGFWVTRKLSTFDTLTYWIVQLAGGASAAFLLRRLPVDVWGPVQLGTPDLASGISRTNGMIFEAVMTFFLVFVVFATAVDERGAMGALFGGPFTGAALNPARAFGPALAANHWTNHGVYWIGPLAGGVVAGWLYDTLFLGKK